MQRRHFLLASAGVAAPVVGLAACATNSAGADPSTSSPAVSAPSESPTAAPSSPSTPTTPSASRTPTPAPARHLLVADFGSDTVTFVDPSRRDDRATVATVHVGRAPYGIALGADGTAWVSTAEGTAMVDTVARRRIALIPHRTKTGPVTTGEYRGGGMGIAIAPDGRQVYVGVNVPGRNGVVEVIDTARRSVVRAVPVGMRPFDVDVAAGGQRVFATNHDSYDVTIIDTSTWRTRSVLVDPYDTGRSLGAWLKPHYAAVRPADGALLLPFEGEKLLIMDPATGRFRIEPMTADTHQHGITVGADGTIFVVGTGGTSDSGNGPSLTIRTPAGKERVVPLDGPHENVAVSPRRPHRLCHRRVHPRRLLGRDQHHRRRSRHGAPAACRPTPPGRRHARRRDAVR